MRLRGFFAVGFLVFAASLAGHNDAARAQDLYVSDLGNNQFGVGEIIIDKSAREFTVPLRVIQHSVPGTPMEFLAIQKGGFKDYESVFELSADAVEFNLASLLIGLNPENATPPIGNFNPEPADGDPVELLVEWEFSGNKFSEPIGAFLTSSADEAVSEDWVYIGSFHLPDGRFAASETKILIGFSHDLESIIQHGPGLGLKEYGSITTNHGSRLLPPFAILRVRALSK